MTPKNINTQPKIPKELVFSFIIKADIIAVKTASEQSITPTFDEDVYFWQTDCMTKYIPVQKMPSIKNTEILSFLRLEVFHPWWKKLKKQV